VKKIEKRLQGGIFFRWFSVLYITIHILVQDRKLPKKNWLRKYDPKRNQMLKQKRHPPNSQITLHLAGFGTFMFKKKTEKVQSYKKETRLIDTPNIKSWIPIALEIQLIK
jgi:hypothetical protein